jgi:hypothetical protein
MYDGRAVPKLLSKKSGTSRKREFEGVSLTHVPGHDVSFTQGFTTKVSFQLLVRDWASVEVECGLLTLLVPPLQLYT